MLIFLLIIMSINFVISTVRASMFQLTNSTLFPLKSLLTLSKVWLSIPSPLLTCHWTKMPSMQMYRYRRCSIKPSFPTYHCTTVTMMHRIAMGTSQNILFRLHFIQIWSSFTLVVATQRTLLLMIWDNHTWSIEQAEIN